MALGDYGSVERLGQTDRDPIVRLVHLGRIAPLDPEHLRPVDQSLGPEEPDRQLVLEPGRAHRDGNRDGLLARPRGPDLERLLADDPVGPVLQLRATHGDDAGRGDVASRREEIGHGRQSRRAH